MSDLIETARQHYSASAKAGELGWKWQPFAEDMRKAIGTFTDPVEVLRHAQSKIAFEHRMKIDFAFNYMHTYATLVRREVQPNNKLLSTLADNPNSIPDTMTEVDGRLVSNMFYWHGRIVVQLGEIIEGIRTVLEIGGGYGAMARLWYNAYKPERYIILDVPESLFFAEVCLKHDLGEDVVQYWDGKNDFEAPIVLVPLCHIGELSYPTHLTINVGSMQEMSEDWINFYMMWLEKKHQTNWFYSLNYGGDVFPYVGESANLWSPRLGSGWSTRYFRPNVLLCDIQAPGRNFLEALYEKTPARGRLTDWSVWRGRMFTRETYLEGLDLFRQDFNSKNMALEFLRFSAEMAPFKELLWVANYLAQDGNQQAIDIRDKLMQNTVTLTHMDGTASEGKLGSRAA